MSELVVEACGPATSVQDSGRYGWQRFGVSPAGAMDPWSLALANALVGNPPDAAAIEFGFVGGAFRLEDGPALLALAGPGAAWSIAGRAVAPGMSALAEPGERVVVGPVREGVYAYLAIGGSFRRAPDMGSLSVHRRSGLGGRPLAAGDRLPCSAFDGRKPLRLQGEAITGEAGPIRVMLGPQDDHFTMQALDTLLRAEFRVSAEADRMGCRLDGPALEHASGYNIVSDGIVAGHIQVPGHGRPVVLLSDRQTTGGYPKIATVITADLARFAQMPPGSAVRFRAVTREEAVAALRAMRRRIEEIAGRLSTAEAPLTTEWLLSENLIDGVASAREWEA